MIIRFVSTSINLNLLIPNIDIVFSPIFNIKTGKIGKGKKT
ncbi:hypothetical protein DB29_01308 [Shouchella clausii]|nr:hypothetical protein DB29_01308 [Shouchella clausii]